jgi:hypothetical protein
VQRCEQETRDHNNQSAESGDQAVPDCGYIGFELQTQVFKILFGGDVVVDRVDPRG